MCVLLFLFLKKINKEKEREEEEEEASTMHLYCCQNYYTCINSMVQIFIQAHKYSIVVF